MFYTGLGKGLGSTELLSLLKQLRDAIMAQAFLSSSSSFISCFSLFETLPWLILHKPTAVSSFNGGVYKE